MSITCNQALLILWEFLTGDTLYVPNILSLVLICKFCWCKHLKLIWWINFAVSHDTKHGYDIIRYRLILSLVLNVFISIYTVAVENVFITKSKHTASYRIARIIKQTVTELSIAWLLKVYSSTGDWNNGLHNMNFFPLWQVSHAVIIL